MAHVVDTAAELGTVLFGYATHGTCTFLGWQLPNVQHKRNIVVNTINTHS